MSVVPVAHPDDLQVIPDLKLSGDCNFLSPEPIINADPFTHAHTLELKFVRILVNRHNLRFVVAI